MHFIFSLIFIWTILCILYLRVESRNVNSSLDPQNRMGPTLFLSKTFVGLKTFSPLLWIYCGSLCKTITHLLKLYKSKKDLGKSWERKTITSFKIWKYPELFCLDMCRCWQSSYLTLAPFHWVFVFKHMRGGMNPWCCWILDVVF